METPLLVTPDLVHPIDRGDKTETRRLRGLEFLNETPDLYEFTELDDRGVFLFRNIETNTPAGFRCPYGRPGDELWTRENWFVVKGFDDVKPRDLPQNEILMSGYMADGKKPDWAGRTRPSIHMPRWMSRHTLLIESVTIERLHSITEGAAKREGVSRGIFRMGPNVEKGEFQLELNTSAGYVDGFKFTWCQLNGLASWEKNPWVWVIRFTLKSRK